MKMAVVSISFYCTTALFPGLHTPRTTMLKNENVCLYSSSGIYIYKQNMKRHLLYSPKIYKHISI